MKGLSYRQAVELMVGPCDKPGMRQDVPKTEFASDHERLAAWRKHGAELWRRSGWHSTWALEQYGVPDGLLVS